MLEKSVPLLLLLLTGEKTHLEVKKKAALAEKTKSLLFGNEEEKEVLPSIPTVQQSVFSLKQKQNKIHLPDCAIVSVLLRNTLRNSR